MSFFQHRLLWSLLATSLFSACVMPPQQGEGRSGGAQRTPPAFFEMQARFNLQYTPREKRPETVGATPPAQQFSGRMEWRHVATEDQLLFMNPLGQGMAKLRRLPEGSVELQLADGTRRVGEADQLLEAALGVPLSLDDLLGWMKASPGSGALVEQDEAGRPTRVRESGWLLFYYYKDGDDPRPLRLDASLDGV
ncbi:MAG: outer membrane lipoprotein LolB, partial [Zoogloeaceae bacterium]|nr:outer membrane lipoprotein LolB [Zoogloeaceae bacterium]